MTRDAYSPEEIAARLGLHPSTVRRRIEDGEIRAVRLGRRVLVPASEIARLLGGMSPAMPLDVAACGALAIAGGNGAR